MSSMSTRSTKKGTNVAKKAPTRKPRPTRSTREGSDSWTLRSREESTTEQLHQPENEPVHHYNGHLTVASRPELDHEEEEGDDANVYSMGPMSQMADMAERVGREVETFAENLDRFLESLPTRDKFDAVLELVTEFKNIAKDAAYRVRKDHEQQRAHQLRQEWSNQNKALTQSMPFTAITKSKLGSTLSHGDAESVGEWRRWQQEADLWDLFSIILNLHHNPDHQAVEEEREEKLRALGPIHRYSSEREVWNHFVLQSDLAKEREQIKAWLEHSVDHQEAELSSISQELQSTVDQGKGMWSRGWMHTREKVKRAKRLNHPATDSAVTSRITALDLDASSRQDVALEEEDAYSERTMWIMCWEMLRRGQSWQDVSKWCVSQNQGWRAVSIGKGSESMNQSSRTLWRNMCYIASQSGHSSIWEAAVYGLLGGNVKAVQKVCHSVDDSLYAYYSAALTQQFDQYLASTAVGRSAQLQRPNIDALKDPQKQIFDLILKLRKGPSTSVESIKPMKIIQSYLLANDVGSMSHTLGYAIAYTDALRGGDEDMIIRLQPFWPEDANQPEAEIALDPQTLRIAIHMSILLRELTNEQLDGTEKDAEENVLVAYIQALRAAGLRELIPLYASRLTRGRYVVSMSRVLEDITSTREQESMLSLLENYNLDSILIINEQLAFLLNEHIAPSLHSPRPFKMLEKIDDTHLYPGQRIIDGFLPDAASESDLTIVRSLQWYNIIKGQWREAFFHMSLALRKCLVAGRLACALSIVNEFPFDSMAIRKSYQVTGKSINPIDHEGRFPANEQAQWERMIWQSKTYYELELLVRAMMALANWRSQEAQFSADNVSHLSMSSAASDLRQAKAEVDEAMSLVLTGRILRSGTSEDEATDLEIIRNQYIPEMVIAYNTVLHSAGSLISRENLIESMDLSVTVANDANCLTECFTASGRMRELVTSFAHTSKTMLILKAAKPWKPRKDKEGKDLSIWECAVSQKKPDHDGERASL